MTNKHNYVIISQKDFIFKLKLLRECGVKTFNMLLNM